jgi:hypothetical protein
MGSLALPSTGLVYTDTDILIDSVETHAVYWSVLQPLWQAAQAGTFVSPKQRLPSPFPFPWSYLG